MRSSPKAAGSANHMFTPNRLDGVRRTGSQQVTHPQRAQRTKRSERSAHWYSCVALSAAKAR